MVNFIQTISQASKLIIHELINEEIKIEKTCIGRQLKLKENIGVISSYNTSKESFQIAINFSEELVKKISSLVHNGAPLVIIDEESKHIVMEIARLIMSNSIISLDECYEVGYLSSPFIIAGSDLTYSANGLVNFMEYRLMNEKLTIAILPIDKSQDIYDMKLLDII